MKKNRIIIVDNEPKHLELLGKSFFENGLGCRTFLYENDESPELRNVRIAFFDINLTSHTADAQGLGNDIPKIIKRNSAVFNALKNAITQYISKDNGPFILIFWTQNTFLVEAFKAYINDPKRKLLKEMPFPILIECINKLEYDEESDLSLSDKVTSIIESDEKIKFIFELEDNIFSAGAGVINKIFKVLPEPSSWGSNDEWKENMDRFFSKIASATLGFNHARSQKQKAVYEGLLPLINYDFLNAQTHVDWDSVLSELVTVDDDKSIRTNSLLLSELNSLFHIETPNELAKDVRGVVIKIPKRNKTLRSFNIDDYEAWTSKILGFRMGTKYEAYKAKILQNSKLIAIEISAACDYSNQKTRINKYILGVIIEGYDKNNHGSRPDSSHHMGGCEFKYDRKDISIWLNLNYVFGTVKEDKRLGEPMFILKKEIMDMLGNAYAGHISRIGITKL